MLELAVDPVTLYLAATIWGSGVRGYGPYRCGRIVGAAGSELEPRLSQIATAAQQGPEAAWDAITKTAKLRWLGPAFATKVAYFAALAASGTGQQPLIADANTSWAMWDLVQLVKSVERKRAYLDYVDLAHSWADDHGWRADEVEYALFEIGKHVERRVK